MWAKTTAYNFKPRTSRQKSIEKEIELHEDDSEAMMALFRFLYGLPYGPDIAEHYDGKAMLQHANVYVVAEKYNVDNLKILVYDNTKRLLKYDGEKTDLYDSIETIINGTLESDTLARKLLIDHCVEYLRDLWKQEDFMALLGRVPDLGIAITGHEGLVLE